MSLARTGAPMASAYLPFIRGTQQTGSRSSRLCVRCLQRQTTFKQHRAPLSRFLATAAVQRPAAFEHDAPPRNTGVPNTSIAGGQPGVDNDARPTPQAREPSGSAVTDINAGRSLSEAEAQRPRPTQNSTSATGSVASPSPSPTRSGRKSKLRPRKAAMTLTPNAVTALRELLDQPEPKLIRVGVKNRGCSGLAYHLEYVDKPNAFDEAVDQDGVKVLIDSKALFSIIGSEMDWIEDKLSRRFVFKNPNITEQCGCGESFSIG